MILGWRRGFWVHLHIWLWKYEGYIWSKLVALVFVDNLQVNSKKFIFSCSIAIALQNSFSYNKLKVTVEFRFIFAMIYFSYFTPSFQVYAWRWNTLRNWVIVIFSWQKALHQNNFEHIVFFTRFFINNSKRKVVMGAWENKLLKLALNFT